MTTFAPMWFLGVVHAPGQCQLWQVQAESAARLATAVTADTVYGRTSAARRA